MVGNFHLGLIFAHFVARSKNHQFKTHENASVTLYKTVG